jgi:photosystem II stability/assembly factor-like uncharacterized protein
MMCYGISSGTTRQAREGGLLLATAVLLAVVHSQPVSFSGVPFVLSWSEGECVGCGIARSLGHIQFTAPMEAWAEGINFSQNGEGTGDYVVVHTKDFGRTWAEVSGTAQHGSSPSFSFSDAANGWISSWNPAEEPRTIHTADRGAHWQDVSTRFVQEMRFLDGAHGYGADGTKFLSTTDGGRSWSEAQIQHLRLIDSLVFLSAEVGWIAGVEGTDFLVFRTADAGRTWSESRTAAPEHLSSVRDLFFLDQRRGWLITWHTNNDGSYLFMTADGGRTWTPVKDESFQGKNKWAGVVRFISASTGFVFETERPSPGGAKAASAPVQSILIYTRDGGAHWSRQALPRPVYECQTFEGDLRCGAGGERSALAVLTVHPR